MVQIARNELNFNTRLRVPPHPPLGRYALSLLADALRPKLAGRAASAARLPFTPPLGFVLLITTRCMPGGAAAGSMLPAVAARFWCQTARGRRRSTHAPQPFQHLGQVRLLISPALRTNPPTARRRALATRPSSLSGFPVPSPPICPPRCCRTSSAGGPRHRYRGVGEPPTPTSCKCAATRPAAHASWHGPVRARDPQQCAP